MSTEQLPRNLLVLGAFLVLASFVWPPLVGGRRAYTEEDAKEYQQASMNLHAQQHTHGATDARKMRGPNGERDGHAQPNEADLKAAQERFAEVQEQRDAALTRGQGTAAVFRWLGILFAAGGGIAFFVNRA